MRINEFRRSQLPVKRPSCTKTILQCKSPCSLAEKFHGEPAHAFPAIATSLLMCERGKGSHLKYPFPCHLWRHWLQLPINHSPNRVLKINPRAIINDCSKPLHFRQFCVVPIITRTEVCNGMAWDLLTWEDGRLSLRLRTRQGAAVCCHVPSTFKFPILTRSVPESWVATSNRRLARNRNWESQSRCQAQE